MALKRVLITPGLSINPKYDLTHLIAYVLVYELMMHMDDDWLSDNLSLINYAGDNAHHDDIDRLVTDLGDALIGKCVVKVHRIRSVYNVHYRIYWS